MRGDVGRATRIALLVAVPVVAAIVFVGWLLVRWDGERIDAEADVQLQNRLAAVNASLQGAHTAGDQNDAWLVQLDGKQVSRLGPADADPPVLALALAQQSDAVGFAEQRVSDVGGNLLVGAMAIPDRTGQKHSVAVVVTVGLDTYARIKAARFGSIVAGTAVASALVLVSALAIGAVMGVRRRSRGPALAHGRPPEKEGLAA